MRRMAKHQVGGALLHDLAPVHDRDLFCDASRDGKVVRYNEQRNPEVLPKRFEELEDTNDK
jgi:hypothetical protein